MNLTDSWVLRLVLGLAAGAAVAGLAYRRQSLSGSGALAAAAMGAAYFTLGGPVWFGVLLAFFGSSTAWSRYKRKHRAKRTAEKNYAKSGRRDALQVLANGGLGLLLCGAHALWPHGGWLAAFAGVMAAVNADTWATELGALSRMTPRALIGGKRVPAGTSGGVTLLGSAAALAGALFIGIVAAILAGCWPVSASFGQDSGTGALGAQAVWLVPIAAAAGFFGCFADSLLGATVQAMYRCRVCEAQTERVVHCARPTAKTRGWRWVTNDAVNFIAAAAAGLLALGLGYGLR
ncbi:DUF92 domain-containing protein [Paenibacillus sp. IB182496]|uniref:DUF92 domain-containing protein n=1 Tax=Paenibacillus sabuli TaxID=2772509 RepID=A0A927BUR9_9BACL|nr:DUF92 domain-containing protein [Paenibacillus sabuli]MBD2846025.1 DUF92 domain-containing protein [Paenibacillus sabuli]